MIRDRKITSSSKELIEQLKLYNQLGKPKELRNMIALQNKNLIYGALNVNGYYRRDNIDIEELEQEAYISLLKAIEDYNPEYKTSFTSYFYQYMKNVSRQLNYYNQDTSLDEQINTEDNQAELYEIIEDEQVKQDFEEMEQEDERRDIRERLKEILTDEELKLIFLKNGIGTNKDPITFKQLAVECEKEYGKTRWIYEKATAKIRRDNYLRNLYNDYENIRFMNTGSIIQMNGSKTNKVYSVVEEAVIKKIEKRKEINKRVEEIIKETMEYMKNRGVKN